MKVLIAGAEGQLGLELKKLLPREGHIVVPLSRKEMDITKDRAVRLALDEHRPDLVVNAAAYTDVDGCETEVDLAYRVNSLGPRNLAVHCERLDCELLYVSTNYVFGGDLESPYEPFDIPDPVSVYARTKLAGEGYVRQLCSRWYIVRSAGIYGDGSNFVRTMLRVGREKCSLRVKSDEYISPTYARDLAEGVTGIMDDGLYGLYHVTNSGACSWYEFAREIFGQAGVEVEVEPVSGSEYPLPAARPANGVLSTLGSPQLRHWKEALADYLERELSQHP